jgi:hypothetical protein
MAAGPSPTPNPHDSSEISSSDDDGYGDAGKPSAYPTGSKFIHGDEELISFDRNITFAVS